MNIHVLNAYIKQINGLWMVYVDSKSFRKNNLLNSMPLK